MVRITFPVQPGSLQVSPSTDWVAHAWKVDTQGLEAPTFDEFCRAATGRLPRRPEAQVAAGGLPAALQVPAGSAKAGVILAWLWRRLHGPAPVRAGTARRLIWALPQRSLLEPAAAEIDRKSVV